MIMLSCSSEVINFRTFRTVSNIAYPTNKYVNEYVITSTAVFKRVVVDRFNRKVQNTRQTNNLDVIQF